MLFFVKIRISLKKRITRIRTNYTNVGWVEGLSLFQVQSSKFKVQSFATFDHIVPSGFKFQISSSRFQVPGFASCGRSLGFKVPGFKFKVSLVRSLVPSPVRFFLFPFLFLIGYWILVIVRLLRLGYSFQISVALSIRKFFISSSGTG